MIAVQRINSGGGGGGGGDSSSGSGGGAPCSSSRGGSRAGSARSSSPAATAAGGVGGRACAHAWGEGAPPPAGVAALRINGLLAPAAATPLAVQSASAGGGARARWRRALPRDAAAQPRGSPRPRRSRSTPSPTAARWAAWAPTAAVGTRSFSTLPPPPPPPAACRRHALVRGVGRLVRARGRLFSPPRVVVGWRRARGRSLAAAAISERDATAQSHKAAAAVISSRRMREPRRTLSR